MSRSCVVATGSWRPKWPVYALIVAVFAGIITLLVATLISPALAEVIKLERHPDIFYEGRIRETPSLLLFAAGVATVVAVFRALLK
jgi:hypothetical protein